jgi:Carboxypeptidase regulatory-like domain/TonB dependent receptor-like, beta-barrel/TonB-dependent Receptor Plug Domain
MKRILATCAFALGFAAAAVAQVDRATLSGELRDSSGAAIAGGTIAVTHSATNVTTRTTTNSEGKYLVVDLRPGRYVVTAEASGFENKAQSLSLETGHRARLDFTLAVGALAENVTVSEATVLLNTSQAAVGTVLDQNAVSKLPLAIRNWDDMLALVAGVQGDRYSEEGGATALGRTGGVNVHGNRSLQNNFLLDGVDNNTISTNVQELSTQVSRPSIDAIEEFKVVTSPYSAEYGRSPGAAISVTTKSGTNAFHGAAYDYYRDEKFDSNSYFNEDFRTEHGLQPFPKFANDQNQFGANLGGPIVKDKAFFFADYEGTRITRGVTRITNTPTLANRQGIFTTAIRDPLTGQPFPGNVIPPSRIDPVARAIFDLLPAPNSPGANNYTRPDAQITDDADRFLGRADLRLTNSDNVFARYIYTTRKRVLPGWFGGIIDGTSSSALADQSMKSHGLVTGWTRIMSPTLVNEFRFSFIKADSDLVQLPFGQDPPAAAVVPGVPTDPLFSGGVTGMTIVGFFGGGAKIGSPNFSPKFQHTRQYEFLNTLSWLRGDHQFKFGVNVLSPMKNEYMDVPGMRGDLGFRATFTGNAVADFLLGYVSDSLLTTPYVVDQRHWATSFFVQDDWKVTSRLSMNLGLRYDFITPALEANNRQANFDPTTGTLVNATDGSLEDRGLVEPDKNNFAPRVGVVYQVTDSMVVRGGYGIFYNLFDRIGSEDQIALNPGNGLVSLQPATATLASGPHFFLRQGFPTGYLDPSRIDLSRAVLRGADRDSPKTTIHQFGVGAQKTFAKVWVVSVDFVGTEGRNLANLINLNQPLPNAAGNNALGPRPFPAVGPQIQWREEKGSSHYKGMDLAFEKRFSSGYSFGMAYTLSECRDNTAEHLTTGGSPSRSQNARDLDAWEGPCGYDNRHRFSANFVFELPFARSSTGVTKTLLGDWLVSGIFSARSGRPFTVIQGNNNVGPYHTGLPNRIGDGEGPETVDKWFDPAAFQAVPSGVFGNAGRNILRGPGWKALDLSLQKRLSAGPTSLVFRWDVFNVFNTVNLGIPNADVSSGAVGTITTLSGDPRLMQFSLRVLF